MSYNSWHIYGYGLCVSDIEGLSTEKIQALLATMSSVSYTHLDRTGRYQKSRRRGGAYGFRRQVSPDAGTHIERVGAEPDSETP